MGRPLFLWENTGSFLSFLSFGQSEKYQFFNIFLILFPYRTNMSFYGEFVGIFLINYEKSVDFAAELGYIIA